jgi:predicted RNase H-like HicB family nuclease
MSYKCKLRVIVERYEYEDSEIEWVVRYPGLYGISGVGSNFEEAFRMAEEAKEMYLDYKKEKDTLGK